MSRIAIDARELGGKITGVGRYLRELLAAWDELPGAASHEFVLCAPHGTALSVPDGATGPSVTCGASDTSPATRLAIERLTSSGRGTLWEQLSLPRLLRKSGADLLFAPAYTAPIVSPVPAVVTVHDVSFAAHPEWFAPRERFRRQLLTRLSAQRAARVLTVSDFSKQEIVRHLRVDPHAIDVIPSGIHTPPAPPEPRPREPLVLYVGSIFNRRHVPELIDGFALLLQRHPDARLVVVGDNRTHPPVDLHHAAARAGAAGAVEIRDYVPDAELQSLYARASAFAFLSDYEGFGFTPLEALAAGAPPVVLDTPVAREIYGPAACYLDAPAPQAIADALTSLLYDDEARARLRRDAAPVLGRYVWRDCAQRTLQVLLACAS